MSVSTDSFDLIIPTFDKIESLRSEYERLGREKPQNAQLMLQKFREFDEQSDYVEDLIKVAYQANASQVQNLLQQQEKEKEKIETSLDKWGDIISKARLTKLNHDLANISIRINMMLRILREQNAAKNITENPAAVRLKQRLTQRLNAMSVQSDLNPYFVL